MVELLRDPAWQGISGIIACVTLLLYLIVERNKLKLPAFSYKIWSFLRIGLIVIFGASLSWLLGVLALVTADAFISRFGYFYGGLLTHIAMGAALGCWFVFMNFALIEEIYYDVKVSSIRILSTMILFGLSYGLYSSLATPTIDNDQLIRQIFFYGLGTWGGGSAIICFLRLDLDEKKKHFRQSNNDSLN